MDKGFKGISDDLLDDIPDMPVDSAVLSPKSEERPSAFKPFPKIAPAHAIIIGAGIAGLSTAHFLKKRGVEVDIIERDSSVGGSVRSTLRDEKYIIELGVPHFSSKDDSLLKLARELSIDSLIVGDGGNSKNRFIFRKGAIHPFPASRFDLLKSPLLSPVDKLRIIAKDFKRHSISGDLSIADAISKRAGIEVLNIFADPLINDIYAGDPFQLEARSALLDFEEREFQRSAIFNILMQLAKGRIPHDVKSFRWGMGTLTARLEESMRKNIHTSCPVERIEESGNRTWKVYCEGMDNPLDADAVIIATPAFDAARLLQKHGDQLAEQLSSICYAPLVTVHSAFVKGDISNFPKGSSVFIPRCEGHGVLSISCPSDLFTGRCPKDEMLISCTMGGARDPAILDLNDDEIVARCLESLRQVLNINTEPRFSHIRRWTHAVPQYAMGHSKKIENILRSVSRLPGIYLAGGYLKGTSASEIIGQASHNCEEMGRYLKGRALAKTAKI